MKAMKKTLAILLSMVMCLSMLPTWALAEAPETDAALMSEEPAADVMQEPIPEETPTAPPEEPSKDAPEETSLQEVIPEAEEQASEEPEPEYEPVSEPDAVSGEGGDEDGAAGIDASPVEEPAEMQPNTVTTQEETGGVPAESGENPAETEIAADPAAENPDAAEAVTVLFRITPENAELAVYTKDNPEHPEEKTVLDPEEDGSFRLIPGEYFYTLTAEGYVTVEEEPLLVVPSEEPVKIEAVMTPVDGQTPGTQTEAEAEEAVLQAEENPKETADLMADSGTCGDNLTWILNDEGTLTISGTGPMTNYPSDSDSPWYMNRSINEILITDGVTSIGGGAFSHCSSLTSVTMPGSVIDIGSSAFCSCSSLTSVIIPDGVTSIGMDTFLSCSSLTNLTIPASVTSIDHSAFSGCNKLTSAGPIGSGSNIQFGWKDAIPDGVLSYCYSLTSVVIPEGVTSIGEYAFSGCSSLTSVTIPEGVTSIGKRAFSYCGSLTNVTIPGSVTSIGSDAFYNCTHVTNVYYNGFEKVKNRFFGDLLPNATWHYLPVEEGWDLCGNKVLWKYDGTARTLFIKGEGDMWDWDNYRSYAPWNDEAGLIIKVVVGSGVTSIGNNAFCEYGKLSSISLPEELIRIGERAFFKCNVLKSITFPDNLEMIGNFAFYGCEGLIELIIPDQATSIGSSAFASCINVVNVSGGENVLSIGSSAFMDCRNLVEFVIPQGVTSVESHTFQNCVKLSKIVIPETVTSIGYYAFLSCSDLIGITLPNNLSYIDGDAFNYSGLATITIPSGVRKINDYAFAHSPLKTIVFQGNPPSISGHSFQDVTANAYYPDNGTWWKEDCINYGGTLTWIPIDSRARFLDVSDPSAYYFEPVLWAVDNGITTGRTATTFDPYGECTRGHIVTFLWRAMGKPEPTVTSNPFNDVKTTDSFYKAVLWAYEKGITTGQTATTFGPWKTCTRGQIVTFLWRAMGQPEPSIGNPFTDVKETDGFCKAVRWAVEKGITTGKTQTTFDPWGTCTRGQAVTFLYRAMS